jgi:hypothetical protein
VVNSITSRAGRDIFHILLHPVVYVTIDNSHYSIKYSLMSCVGVTINGVWTGDSIDHLHTRLANTSNYSATANLHKSQITTAPAKPFKPALSLPAGPWQRHLKAEILQLQALMFYLHSLPCRIAYHLATDLAAPIVIKITPRHGPRRKQRSFSYTNRFQQRVA